MDRGSKVLLLAETGQESKQYREHLTTKTQPRFEVAEEPGLAEGLARLDRDEFEAVIFSLNLPDSRGLATYFKLRVKAPHLPLIALTDLEESALGLEAVRRGAQDSLVKSQVNRSIILQSLKAGIEHMRHEARLREMALRDPLTGLLSRTGFLIVGGHQLRLSLRTKSPVTLVFADIDRLEDINLESGREEGDAALKAAASVMKKTFRASDIMARLDADEFVLLAPYCAEENAGKLIDRWQSNLAEFLRASKSSGKFSLSLGAAAWSPDTPSTLEQLLVTGEWEMWKKREEKAGRSA